MEYSHAQAVADNVNVDFDTYRIRTEITEQGGSVSAGYAADRRDRRTRKVLWEQLSDDLTYTSSQLDRDVVAVDQIRTVVRTFRERLFTEIFPGRREVPKTIIFAKDDSHAEDIVEIVRNEFGKGNDFCQKITYKTTGVSPEQLLQDFRNSYIPRIAVTVDMIDTGTDIKPVEIVFFMRNVRSRSFFEQMKGRGVRVTNPTEFQSVTPDAANKERFVIVDAVGVTENALSDSYSLERQPTVSFEKLLDLVGMGNRDADTLSSLASRLAGWTATSAPRTGPPSRRKRAGHRCTTWYPASWGPPARTRRWKRRRPPPAWRSRQRRPSRQQNGNSWRPRPGPSPPTRTCGSCW